MRHLSSFLLSKGQSSSYPLSSFSFLRRSTPSAGFSGVTPDVRLHRGTHFLEQDSIPLHVQDSIQSPHDIDNFKRLLLPLFTFYCPLDQTPLVDKTIQSLIASQEIFMSQTEPRTSLAEPNKYSKYKKNMWKK